MTEDKWGTKRSRSHSKEGSSSPSGGSAPQLALSGCPPPPGSPSEISSRRPFSSVFEQGGPSEKVPMVDPSSSSDNESLIPDTSWDVEFARRLFGDLNHAVHGPPDDGKVINFIEATPSSIVKSPAPTASTVDANDVDNSRSPDRAIGGSSNGGDEVGLP
jgi:hypothetical protein